MKKLILAFSMVAGTLAAYSQDTTSMDQTQQQYRTTQDETTTQDQTQDQTTQLQQDRERINSRDLPDGVKRSLEGQEYRGWLINAAYKTTDQAGMNQQGDVQGDTTAISGTGNTSGQEVYVVELKNGAQTKTVRFNKDGEELDGQGGGDQN